MGVLDGCDIDCVVDPRDNFVRLTRGRAQPRSRPLGQAPPCLEKNKHFVLRQIKKTPLIVHGQTENKIISGVIKPDYLKLSII